LHWHSTTRLRYYVYSGWDASEPIFNSPKKLLVWLLEGWREVAASLPDIYQRGPNAIRDKATAKNLVAILEDHGRLVRLPGGATVVGQHRREAWRIVRG
jgi:hypothetical protein